MNGQLEYALEGSVFIGGAIVQWLRDELGLIQKSAEIESLAGSVPDNGGVYLVPAITLEISAEREGLSSWQPQVRVMDRAGYGLRWGQYWGGV